MSLIKRRRRILVANGDRNLRGVIRSILESADYKVNTVDTAARAMKEVEANTYDLLVLDITLPGNMVVKLFRTLKKSEEYSRIPILFTLSSRTPESLDPEKREIVERGDGCLQKPFQAKTFLDNVRAVLEKPVESRESRADSPRWMVWMPRRRQPVAVDASSDSKRRSQQ